MFRCKCIYLYINMCVYMYLYEYMYVLIFMYIYCPESFVFYGVLSLSPDLFQTLSPCPSRSLFLCKGLHIRCNNDALKST